MIKRIAFLIVSLTVIISCSKITMMPCCKDVKVRNTLGIEMVGIPAGEFLMGSNLMDDEKPIHKVYLNKFFISSTEVTMAQYKKFIDETNYKKPLFIDKEDVKDYPVIYVTYDDATAFCDWLSKKTGKKYRLPTEAEWEKSARGGLEDKLYPWGDEKPDTSRLNFNRDWDGIKSLTPVKSYPANGYGLYDVAGNVWEWCLDYYDKDYYKESLNKNPNCQKINKGNLRVLRGGGWGPYPEDVRCSKRNYYAQNQSNGSIGFRIVREK